MTPAEFRTIFKRHNLRWADMAWIIGKSVGQIHNYISGKTIIPPAVELVMLAFDQGKIDAKWLVKHIKKPIP